GPTLNTPTLGASTAAHVIPFQGTITSNEYDSLSYNSSFDGLAGVFSRAIYAQALTSSAVVATFTEAEAASATANAFGLNVVAYSTVPGATSNNEIDCGNI